ncbi:protein TolB [Wolbachia endosymbiont of Pentidionis agamae]|uniref:protein TolB n=1 Tax=Wolbachia endosymbiont of Pentidionis agamae TaxID=3110435 RepID=UPI002FD2E98E
MKSFFILYLLCIPLLGYASNITKNIIISPFLYHSEVEDRLSSGVIKLIKENLSYSCYFRILEANETSGSMDGMLLTGSVNELKNGKFMLVFSIVDMVYRKELVSESMVFLEKDLGKISHSISDVIYSKVIGECGYLDTRIAYVAEEKEEQKYVRRIAVMNHDGKNLKYLTDGNKFVSTPRFSPNGKKIIYIAYINDKSYLMLRDLKKNDVSVAAVFDGVSSAPRFSSSGKSLLISHSYDGKTSILSLDLDKKKKKEVIKNLYINTSPSFSPNQKSIVFSSDMNGSQQLYVMDLTKKINRPRRISAENGTYSMPVWSPIGNLIAFTKILSGKFYIGIMKPDGTEERILTAGYKVEAPAWSPDGKTIIFTKTQLDKNGSSSKLYSIDFTGKNEKAIATPTNASLADWSHF